MLIILLLISFAFSLDLKDLWREALKNNSSLKAQKRAVISSEYELKAYKNLYLPKFSINYSQNYQNEKQRFDVNLPVNLEFSKRKYKVFSASITELLYDFGRREKAIGIAKEKRDIEKLKYERKKRKLLLEVGIAYLNLLRAKGIIEIYQKEYEAVSSHYELAKALYEKGLVAFADLLEAKVRLSEVKAKLERAKSDYRIALFNLSRLTGISKERLKKIKKPEIKLQLKNPEEYIKTALKNREELRIYRRLIEIAKKEESVSVREFLPSIFLKVSYDYTDRNPILEPKGITTFSLGILASFQGVKPYYDMKAKKEVVLKLLNELEDLKKLIELEVKTAYERLENASIRLGVAREALRYAREHYRLALGQYKNQLISHTDLITAEARLTNARKRLVLAEYEILESYLRLLEASGLIGGEL
ncbi:TolC family protein [Aquifex pyrophilus]